MTEIAKAYVQIIPSAQGIGSKLRSEMGGELDSAGTSAGESWGAKFASAAKKAIAALGIGKVVGDALNAGADYEQNLGGTEAVFGEFAKNIQSTAKEAYKNMGLSASDYMATANKMGSLFQGSGLEQSRALDLTTQAMQRAADVASVMGLDTQMAMESIAGAAKGNFTMMDNLGVAMNATTLEAYALEKGINFKWNVASNAEKAELAMQMFFDRTQQYAGNFSRESEQTFSGSLGAMKAAWQDTLATLSTGGALGPVLSQLGQTIHTFFFNNFIPMIGNIVSALPQVIGDLSGMLISELNHVSEHTDELLQFAVEVVTGIVEGLIDAAPQLAVAALNLAMSLGESLINFDWIGTVDRMITNIRTNFEKFATSQFGSNTSIVDNIISGIGKAIPKLISTAGELITHVLQTIIQNLPEFIAQGAELVGHIVLGILQALPEIIFSIGDMISGIFNVFMNTDWMSIGANIINGIINGLGALLPNLIEAAKNVARAAWETAKNWLGISSPSKKFAELGMYTAEGFAEGMNDNTGVVAKAALGISQVAESELAGDYALGSAAGIGSTGMAANSTNSSGDIIETLGRLNRILSDLEENGIPAFAYLDGKDVTDTVTRYQRRAMRANA